MKKITATIALRPPFGKMEATGYLIEWRGLRLMVHQMPEAYCRYFNDSTTVSKSRPWRITELSTGFRAGEKEFKTRQAALDYTMGRLDKLGAKKVRAAINSVRTEPCSLSYCGGAQ